MAATSNPARPDPHPTVERWPQIENPILRGIALWHLLSLDAPTVAMLWTWFIAGTNHIALPETAVLAMGIAVWTLYAADRLLDTRDLEPHTSDFAVTLTLNSPKGKNAPTSPTGPTLVSADLEPRHYFHFLHRRAFRFAISLAAIFLALLLPSLPSRSVLLYLILGTLLSGYFVIIHIKSGISEEKTHRLPKELAVGVFFSAATFIPTVARNPTLGRALFPGAVLFAVLCSLNCLFIYAWEHPASSPQAHPATRIALRFLPQLSIAAAAAGFLLSPAKHSLPWRIPIACSIAALLLLLLHKSSHRLSPTTLRASADLCLLTPLLLLRF